MSIIIAHLIERLADSSRRLAEIAAEAEHEAHLGNQNGAIGALLEVRQEVDIAHSLLTAILTLNSARRVLHS